MYQCSPACLMTIWCVILKIWVKRSRDRQKSIQRLCACMKLADYKQVGLICFHLRQKIRKILLKYNVSPLEVSRCVAYSSEWIVHIIRQSYDSYGTLYRWLAFGFLPRNCSLAKLEEQPMPSCGVSLSVFLSSVCHVCVLCQNSKHILKLFFTAR